MAHIVALLPSQRKLAGSSSSPRHTDLPARSSGACLRRTTLFALLMCCLPMAAFGAVLQPKAVLNTHTLANLAGAAAGAQFVHADTAAAAVPTLSVSASTVAFGNVPVSTTVAQSITLESTGSAAVTISSAGLTGGANFTVSGASFPLTLSPGQAVTLTVKFDPKSIGAASGQLTLVSNSSTNGTLPVALSGAGIAVLTKVTCIHPTMTGAGQDGCTAWLNTAAPVGGFAVNLASSNASATVPAQVTVPAGAVTVGFWAAVSSVNVAQTATVSASAQDVTETVAIQLNANAPVLSISASSANFGSVNVNAAATQLVTLSSTGAVAVTVNAASLSGAGFSVSGAAFPLTLNPNQTATLTVQFNPTAAGAASGTLTLASNSSTGAASVVALTGTGMPVVSTLSCANASMTGAGTDACIVSLNTAAASGGFPINLASSNASVTVPASVTVAAGATSVSFSATIASVSTAQAVTLSAAAVSSDPTFSLQLNPAVPTLAISSSSIGFGSVNVNTATSQSITLSSTGTASVTVNSATLTGSGFSISGVNFPLTLSPNQTATLTVQFDPTAAGAASGTLTIASNSSTNGTTAIALTGDGTPVVSTLSCATASMTGAGTDACTVSLNTAAASGGFPINLASSNASVTVPASVTVAAGAASASFSATVASVSTAQAVTLSATATSSDPTFSLQLNPAVPTLVISSSSIGFGSVNVNTASSQSITLSSTGTASVTVNSATVAGSGFSISGVSFPLTLSPNQTATLTVQFEPTAAGTASGTLTIASNSSTGASSVIALSGTGQSTQYVVDLTWDAPASSTDPVAGYNVLRSPSTSSTYQLVSSVGAGQVAYVDSNVQTGLTYNYIVESVDAAGNQSTPSNLVSVTIPGGSSSSSTPEVTTLSCTNASITGAGTDLCTVTLSAAAASGGLSVSLTSSNAAVAVPSSVAVASGASAASFSATVASVSAAETVTISASAGSTDQSFALALNASGSTLSINATSVAFGTVDLSTPATQSLTLTATGGAAVTVNSATVAGAGFTVSGATFPLTLNPNQTATLSVVFDPTVAGAATGQLTISSSASTDPSAGVSLTGTGQTSDYTVNLTWDAPTSSTDPVAGYNVYRAVSGSSAYQQVNASVVTQTAFVDSNVQVGQTYQYIVESVDATGDLSVPSNVASVVIP